ncbi:hypothetical protein NDU88_007798 [Pleurodeles waltl]|uniref:Uncharacterized protein n=1 Tax=Pleurodeles waltl TaxID=8319 RepID=A0AAV7STS1_PLEWA|nr:hypothetical protein NDU88_007798 [Pleurodeles waltl]
MQMMEPQLTQRGKLGNYATHADDGAAANTAGEASIKVLQERQADCGDLSGPRSQDASTVTVCSAWQGKYKPSEISSSQK